MRLITWNLKVLDMIDNVDGLRRHEDTNLLYDADSRQPTDTKWYSQTFTNMELGLKAAPLISRVHIVRLRNVAIPKGHLVSLWMPGKDT